MRAVYYSIACTADSRCEAQWVQSIRSLRRYNREIAVWLFVYGVPQASTLAEARRCAVELRRLGAYRDCFRHLPAQQAAVLALHPVLHRLLSLTHCPLDRATQILFVDCDTFFFSDVAQLFDRYHALHWYAREEPYSSRSAFGYDPDYLDETLAAEIAEREDAQPIAPYNAGVLMMNHGVWHPLLEHLGDYLGFTWRLLVGQCRWPRAFDSVDERLLAAVRAHADDLDWQAAVPFASRNAWIVDQLALGLTLGRIPGLAHDTLAAADVAQGGEQPTGACVLAHYFSSGEDAFFAQTAPLR